MKPANFLSEVAGISPEWVSEFVELLRVARELDEGDPESKRDAWVFLLRLLASLAEGVDPAVERDGLTGQVNDLCIALRSLDYGHVEAALQPRVINHRAPTPKLAMLRGFTAAAAELLIRGGATATQADAILAKRLKKAGYQRTAIGGSDEITAGTIKGWRKAVSQAERGNLMKGAANSWLERDFAELEHLLPDLAEAHPLTLAIDDVEKPENVDLREWVQYLATV